MEHIQLDETDYSILDMLKSNSKVRIHIIARKLGIPSSTVHHRIKKLEEKSIIKKWTIIPDPKKVGFNIKSFVLIFVDVTNLKRIGKTQKDIAEILKKIPNVENVDIITGEADLLVSIRAGDMQDFQNILLDKIQSIEGIVKTKTMISLNEFY